MGRSRNLADKGWQLPDYAAPEIGQFLRVDATGNSLEWGVPGSGTTILAGYYEDVATPSSVSGVLTLAVGYNVNEVTLTENVTTLALPSPASGDSFNITLILKQDATGSRTFAWPASVKWAGGASPSISSAANAIDIYNLMTTDGGTTWYGFTGGKGFA